MGKKCVLARVGIMAVFALGAGAAMAQTATLSQPFTVLVPNPGPTYGVSLAVDASGNVFVTGTTNKFEDVPNGSGGYTAYNINSYLPNATVPYAMVADSGDNLYLAANQYVVKGTATGVGTYTQSLLPYTNGSTTWNKAAGIALDANGNIYVLDSNLGILVKETPSGSTYTASLLYSNNLLKNCTGLSLDKSGNFYAATSTSNPFAGSGGVNAVYQISPSGSSYTVQTIGSGWAGPTSTATDKYGNVWVADYAAGKMYELVPNGSGGFNQVLYQNLSTVYVLATSPSGQVYANTYLTQVYTGGVGPLNFVSSLVGTATAAQSIVVNFTSSGTLANYSVQTQGISNLDFKDTGAGSCSIGTSYTAGSTCTISVNFKPIAPGKRTGAIVLYGSTGTAFATEYLYGVGTAPEVAFSPALQSTVLTTVSPAGLAVDTSGSLYVSDASTTSVEKLPSSGGSFGAAQTLASGLPSVLGTAVDGAGNVYIADCSGPAVELPWTGSGYGTKKTLPGTGQCPVAVAGDGAGDVYVLDSTLENVQQYTWSTIANVFNSPLTIPVSGLVNPTGIAADANGDLFIAEASTGSVFEVPTSGTQKTLATGLGQLTGIALDANNSVYVTTASPTSSVIKVPFIGTAYASPVTLATAAQNGLGNPSAIAVDASGNIYVGDKGNSNVVQLAQGSPAPISFPTPTVENTTDSADGASTLTVSNIGNAALTFPKSGTATNPSISTGFSIGNSSTCPQVTPSSFAAGSLAAGASCTDLISFAPVTTGNISGSLVTTDNNLNVISSTQSVGLSGNAIPPVTLSPAAGALPNASYGVAYSQQFTAGGGASPYTYAIVSGTLPPGLTLNSSTGLLSGAPTFAADGNSYTFSVIAIDSGSNMVSQQYTLAVPQVFARGVLSVSSTPVGITTAPSITVPAGSPVYAILMLYDTAGEAYTGGGAAITIQTASTTAALSNLVVLDVSTTETLNDTAAESLTLAATFNGNVISTATANFVAPAYVVTVSTDEASGSGVASNCVATGLTGDNSNCSLRDAVAAANALTGVTTNISFSLPNPSTILIAQSNPVYITQNVNLNGPGASALTIEGGTTPLSSANNPILQTAGNANVSISGLTFANGYALRAGGAISANGTGNLSVSNTTFSGNRAGNFGPALYCNLSATLTVTNSIFLGNQSAYNGGAIFAEAGCPLIVSGSTFSGNQAAYSGGAIYASGAATVANSTFSGQHAVGGYGGAIDADSTLTLANSTFSGNESGNTGGAIYANSGLTVTNSIFAGDTAQRGTAIFANSGGSVSNVVYQYDNFNGVTPTNSIVGNPNLGGLLNYGGTTPTLLPLPGSAAICAGTQPSLNGTPLTTDQRGVTISGSRYGQSACYDVGAVQTEYALAFTTSPGNTLVGQTLSPAPVALVTEDGTALTSGTTSVAVSAAAGTLSGTTTQSTSAINGHASFPGLSLGTVETADTLTATLALTGSINLTAQSNSFNVTSDPVSAVNSSLTVSPNPAVAGSSVQVTATVVDTAGNPISGATVTFMETPNGGTTSLGVIFSPGIATTNSAGVATTVLEYTSADTLTLSAVVSGAGIGSLSTTTVQFVAPAYVVTVNTDEASGSGVASNCVATGLTGDNSNCSLRDAVAAANALSGVTTNISFSLPNPSTILIAQTGGITISQNVNLNGPGANQLTLEGGTTPLSTSNNRILQITNGNVSVTGLTFANGYTGTGTGSGGAIDARGGTLTLSNSTFSGNRANFGGAVYAFNNSTLTVSNSTFSGNQASGAGGAVAAGNNSTLTVSNSTFSGNQASNGGAIIANSTLTVSNSTFSGNQLSGNGSGSGGAIFANVNSTLTVSNSIFTGDAARQGSAISASGPGATVTNIVSNGESFNNVTPTNTINADPKLGGLLNYGGPTPTMLPLPGSAAICAGTQPSLNGTPLTTDQRGVAISGSRYGQSGCYDVGAVQTEYTFSATFNLPSQVLLGSPVTPAPVALVTENGIPFSNAVTTVYMTDADSDLSAAATVSVGTDYSTGHAYFTNLIFTNPEVSDTLTATLPLNSNLSLSATSSSFQVGQLPQTITGFNPPATATYGQTPITLSATGGASGNPVTFKVNSGPGSISGSTLTITGAGTIVVEADQAGTTVYSAAKPVTANIIVSPAMSVTIVTCSPTSVTYNGAAQTPCTASVTGVGGLNQSVPVTYSSNVSAGVNTASATATYPGDTNHAASTASTTFTITQATPVVTWANPPSIVYGTGTGAAQKTATATGVGGVSLTGTFFYTTPDGTVFGVGTHPLGVAFLPTDSTDYVPVSAYAYITVTKATPTVIWSAPAAITYGTALSGAQLNATASVPGSFSYSLAVGTVLHAGAQTLSVTFTPNDTSDYNPVTTTVPLTVNKATPVITWPTPASITYGTPLSNTQLDATASYLGNPVPGTFLYTAETGPNPLGVLLVPGTTALSATITPTDSVDYNSATAYVVFTISKAQTSTTLAVTTTQTVTGTTATITATVHPQIGGTPTGTVTYYNGSTVLGSAAVGTPFTTGVLPVGTDQITAVYSGDSNFVGSSSSASAVTSLAPTTVQLTSPLTHVFYPASSVSFTVIVPLKGLQLISGTVTLYDGSTVIGTYSLPAGGILAGVTPQLSVGTHSLRAVYGGSAQYPPGQSPVVTVTVSAL